MNKDITFNKKEKKIISSQKENKKKKIITCAGYDGTGSSLIMDYLKEFDEIKTFGSFEFRFLHEPHGVGDLEDSLLKNNCRLNSDRAIYDYLKLIKILNSNFTNKFWKKSKYKIAFGNKFLEYSEEYIKNLIDVEWTGYWHDFEFRDFSLQNRVKNFVKRTIFLLSDKKIDLKNKYMCYSFPIDKFYPETKKYLNKLFDAATNKSILAIDQLVPCCNIDRYLKYFDNIKVIVLDRDPRDLYILHKKIWHEGVVPTSNVELFIKHFKAIRAHQHYEIEDKNKILRIRFEDIVYNYDGTIQKINEFLGIKNLNHKYPKKFFNPNVSINNTQLFYLYPELNKDVKIIEKELKEYCYNFPYKISKRTEKVF